MYIVNVLTVKLELLEHVDALRFIRENSDHFLVSLVLNCVYFSHLDGTKLVNYVDFCNRVLVYVHLILLFTSLNGLLNEIVLIDFYIFVQSEVYLYNLL